ncbi:MAG: 3-phosphoshikimate 1-carboxyvinyltransferase [Candidatus Omnitrophica bacterium]|nr:3-phosphoshikimate 1-carboxyvinyltransferase [Candidatus Omnitrophota bacterium]
MGFSLTGPVTHIKGVLTLPGDKSIAHRAIIVSALCRGKTKIENFPASKDCLYTLSVFKKLGIRIDLRFSREIVVYGKGLRGLDKPAGPIFVGESGTTLRLLLGVFSGQDFKVKLITARSLSRRPMLRVTLPLRMMGAQISAKGDPKKEEYPPITIRGGRLESITYKIPVASAQVKSAILLAGLFSRAKTTVFEPLATRDHTERMLKLFKADIKVKGNKIVIAGDKDLSSPGRVYIPGDISSASFFIVLANILPDAEITIRRVGINPSRTGIVKVLKRMGADIRCARDKSLVSKFEPMADITAKSSLLKGTIVRAGEIPSLIDELPILMVAASLAKGETVFKGVGELRVKETDRIRSMSENLRRMGVPIRIIKNARSEDIVIKGVKELKGTRVKSFGDHRTAMSMIVAGLKAQGVTSIDDISCIDKSFPDFLSILKKLIR